MPDIEKIEDGYIDEVIKDNQVGTPDPSKTSGRDLQELIKAVRDRYEQEITRLTSDYDEIEERINTLETHFKGVFLSLQALQSAFPTANVGDYANVDPGSGAEILRYIWDDTNSAWVIGGGNLTDFASIEETLLGIINNKAVQPNALEAKFDATKIFFADTDFQGTGSEADPLKTKSPINFGSDDFSGEGTINDPIKVKFKEFLQSLPGWVDDGSKVLTSELVWQVGQSTPLLAAPGLESTAIGETEISNVFSPPVNTDGPVSYELQLATKSNFSDTQTIYSGEDTTFNVTDLVPGSVYYLRLRASRTGYSRSLWASVAVTTGGTLPGYTLESTVLVNFSNQYLPQTDDGEWNMLKITADDFGQGNSYTRTDLRDKERMESTGISIYIEGFEIVGNSFYPPDPSESAIYPDFVIISGLVKTTTNSDGSELGFMVWTPVNFTMFILWEIQVHWMILRY